ncbi:MAG: hypothetical protein FWE36_02350 [Erysipelotrichales bacterium]|nr:hypothetical protein [Erysipelotrichales bacterium]
MREFNLLGDLFEFAVCYCLKDADETFDLFLACGLAKKFEKGELTNYTGQTLFCEIYQLSGRPTPPMSLRFFLNNTEEYWAGQLMDCYRQKYKLSLKEIRAKFSFNDFLSLYHQKQEKSFAEVAFILEKTKNK